MYQSVDYKKRLLRGEALKTYKDVLEECKETAKGISGDQWIFGKANDITVEGLWAWAKQYGMDVDVNVYLGMNKCILFEKGIGFRLGKSM